MREEQVTLPGDSLKRKLKELQRWMSEDGGKTMRGRRDDIVVIRSLHTVDVPTVLTSLMKELTSRKLEDKC